jgi:ATP-dependent helicase YprA (DUF1998 family)
MLEVEVVEQHLEALAVLGQVDGVGAGSKNGHARIAQSIGQLQRRLAAELHDDAGQRSLFLLF